MSAGTDHGKDRDGMLGSGRRARLQDLGAATLLLGLLAASLPAAQPVESPARGYRLEVPEGWRHRFDEEGDSLLLGAPGGFRVRIEVQVRGAALARDDLLEAYRRDGRSLKARYQRLAVTRRPTRAGKLGERSAYTYHFAYRDLDATVMEVRTWLGSGPSRQDGLDLHVRLRAHGERRLFPRYQDSLARLRASFRFPPPTRSPEDLPAAPQVLGGDPLDAPLASVDLPPLPLGSPGQDAGAVATAGVLPSRAVPPPVYTAADTGRRRDFLASFGIKREGDLDTVRQRAGAALGFQVP